jgi:hypothetical protein
VEGRTIRRSPAAQTVCNLSLQPLAVTACKPLAGESGVSCRARRACIAALGPWASVLCRKLRPRLMAETWAGRHGDVQRVIVIWARISGWRRGLRAQYSAHISIIVL